MHGFVSQLMSALEPWEAEHTYLNFAETRRKPTTLFSSASYHRLRQIKAILDPRRPDQVQPSCAARRPAEHPTLVGLHNGLELV